MLDFLFFGPFDLRSSSDHILDEVPVSWSINDGDVVSAGLKLPKRDVDGDATLTLCLQLVQNPGVFEGTLSHLVVVEGEGKMRRSHFIYIAPQHTQHKKITEFNVEPGFTGRSVQKNLVTKRIKFKWEEDDSYLSSFLLKLFNCSLVNAPTLVDEVAGRGGLARVDMSYYHNVYVELLLPHRDSR